MSVLEGSVVAIPAARKAASTAELVRRHGGRPLVGPTTREVPATSDQLLRRTTDAVIANPPDVAIHLTGVGTERWFEAARAWGRFEALAAALSAAVVVARGVKTASVLRRFGLCEAWRPPSETSDEIATWMAHHLPLGGSVVVQLHGGDIPHEIARAALARRADVLEAMSYRWALPVDLGPARRMVADIADGRVDVLVVTAGPQVSGILEVAAAMGLEAAVREAMADRVFVGAVGGVAARTLAEQGLACHHVADPPRLGTLVRDLARVTRSSPSRDHALPA